MLQKSGRNFGRKCTFFAIFREISGASSYGRYRGLENSGKIRCSPRAENPSRNIHLLVIPRRPCPHPQCEGHISDPSGPLGRLHRLFGLPEWRIRPLKGLCIPSPPVHARYNSLQIGLTQIHFAQADSLRSTPPFTLPGSPAGVPRDKERTAALGAAHVPYPPANHNTHTPPNISNRTGQHSMGL